MTTPSDNLQALLQDPPQFKLQYMKLKCPDFIVNAILAKQEIVPEKAEFFWENIPAATAESSAINVYLYQPEYQ